jgi:membrane protein YdbS with pleckstrin-like domain
MVTLDRPRRIAVAAALVTVAAAEVVGWTYYAAHPSVALATALSLVLGVVTAFLLPRALARFERWLLRHM